MEDLIVAEGVNWRSCDEGHARILHREYICPLCEQIVMGSPKEPIYPNPEFVKPSGECPHTFVGKIFCPECSKDDS